MDDVTSARLAQSARTCPTCRWPLALNTFDDPFGNFEQTWECPLGHAQAVRVSEFHRRSTAEQGWLRSASA